MAWECLRHDSDQHVEDNDLANEGWSKKDGVDEDILHPNKLCFRFWEALFAAVKMSLTKVTHHQEDLVDESVPEERRAFFFIIEVVKSAALLNPADLQDVENNHEHGHQLQEDIDKVSDVRDRFTYQVDILCETIEESEPEEHLQPDAK